MRLLPQSLRFRVLLYVFATTLVIMLLLGSLIFQQIRTLTLALTQEELLEQARRIASYIEYDWRGDLDLDIPKRRREYYEDSKAHQYAVMNTQGQVLFQSDDFHKDHVMSTMEKGGKHFFNFQTKDGLLYTGIKYDFLFEDKIYPIFILEHEAEFGALIYTLEKDFLLNILVFGLPLLIFQGLLVFIIFSAAFRPVFRAAEEARNIRFDNLSYRLSEKNIHKEILPLVHNMNISLARLEKSAKAQKFFIANAAHELRTPISILKARIASLKDESEIYILNEDLRNINRLISQMLDISRLDSAESQPRVSIELNSTVQKACADIGELYIARNKELSLEERAKNQIIMGNEDILYRAILNLLENALKHTPENSRVKVIVDLKKVIVRDYGPPISEDSKTRIFEAFEKAPENMNTKGAGLGLSIVRKAAEFHKGSVSLETRKDGNDFILRFD